MCDLAHWKKEFVCTCVLQSTTVPGIMFEYLDQEMLKVLIYKRKDMSQQDCQKQVLNSNFIPLN